MLPFPTDAGDITGFENAGDEGEFIEVGFFGLAMSDVFPFGLEMNCFHVSFLSTGDSSCT